MFSSNVTGIPQMQMRVSCVYIASHCIPSASGAFVFLAVMRVYLLICVLMARAVALPLVGGVNNMTGYYSRVGGGFYFSCLSGGATQSMQH